MQNRPFKNSVYYIIIMNTLTFTLMLELVKVELILMILYTAGSFVKIPQGINIFLI